MSEQPIGLYLHIPFCRGKKCPYCDFYSLAFEEELADSYTDALIQAIKHHPFGNLQADTLYLGGGTPSLLGSKRLDALLQAAVRPFGLSSASEVSLEANPESVTPELLNDLHHSGFNRISIGVQSGVDSELAKLGRTHTAEQAKQALIHADKAGFEHISADLMLAIPEQDEKSLQKSIEFLTSLPVSHISAYLLKIEKDTPYGKIQQELCLPDQDFAADIYIACSKLLEEAGFERYEISNFSRTGEQCRHNLKYWRCAPYLGLGPAAHSYLLHEEKQMGIRYFFEKDLKAFINAEDSYTLMQDDGEGGTLDERLMLALRLTEGFDTESLKKSTIQDKLLCKANKLAAKGLCKIKGKTISLTGEGMLISNSITLEFLETIKSL